MSSNRWKRIETLFHQALEKRPEERSAFLDAACSGDSELRAEVQTLLERDELDDGFLDAPSKVRPGARLGQFEILSPLGKGGMGEVWRARDTTLGREVAIKTLPDAFAGDPDRLARFEREARLLASLNHPNIAVIHGLEESAGTRFLVMELIEGQTLAEMLGAGPLPLEPALKIGIQIAEALETAHANGVIHRDLKPANVKVSNDGKVKVLDFGLAKAIQAGSGQDLPDFGSLRTGATAHGVILGTPAYMAPEQARGQAVDRRADIFAFGCLLYEMLTGGSAFQGESLPEVLSRVLEREPDWTRFPPKVPSSVRRLIRLCLEKDPAKRRQWAGDVRIDLEEAMSEPAGASHQVPAVRAGQAHFVWIAGAIVLFALLAIPAVIHLREARPPEMRLELTTPPTDFPLHFAVSPDGQSIAFVAQPSSDVPERLYLRRLDDETSMQPIPNTEGARFPCWSPDSRSIAFFALEQIFHIDVAGGPAQPLATATNPPGACAWGEAGILYTPDTVSPLMMIVPGAGSGSVPVTRLDRPLQTNHRLPSFLPDGLHFLLRVTGNQQVSGIYLGSLDDETPRRLTPVESAPFFLPPDRVVFAEEGALVARRLDLERGELTGDPETLAPSVGSGLMWLSASATGVLAYRSVSGNRESRLTWFDRDGNVLGDLEAHNGPELSPDDRYLAGERVLEGFREVVVRNLLRDTIDRLTNHSGTDGFPLWCPDAQQLVFESNRAGTFGLWIGSSSRPNEEILLLDTPAEEIPVDCSMDGRYLLYRRTDEEFVSADLLALPMTGEDRDPVEVVTDPRFEENFGSFSPDGRWVAYDTDQSGRPEVRVVRFPELDVDRGVSTNGGRAPRWTSDGEINFVALDGWMMAVAVSATDSTFEAELPERLFPTDMIDGLTFNRFNHSYDVSSDGRFLVESLQGGGDLLPIVLVTNWQP